MISLDYAEGVRAACELLHDLAILQAQNDQHPLALHAAAWLDHVGAVAAGLAQGVAKRPATGAPTLPPFGVMQ